MNDQIRKNFTKVPNEILSISQLSIGARYLYCVLLRYCGQDEWCFPGQKTLAEDLSISIRHIRNLLNELIEADLVFKKRQGWNRTNTYRISKKIESKRKDDSLHLGSAFPLHKGNVIPSKKTYLKGKGKRSIKGFEKLRKTLKEIGLINLTKKENNAII